MSTHSRRTRSARPQPAQHPGRGWGPDDDRTELHAFPTQRAGPTIDVESSLEQVRLRWTGDADPRGNLRQTSVRLGLDRRPRHDLPPPARVGSEDTMVAHPVRRTWCSLNGGIRAMSRATSSTGARVAPGHGLRRGSAPAGVHPAAPLPPLEGYPALTNYTPEGSVSKGAASSVLNPRDYLLRRPPDKLQHGQPDHQPAPIEAGMARDEHRGASTVSIDHHPSCSFDLLPLGRGEEFVVLERRENTPNGSIDARIWLKGVGAEDRDVEVRGQRGKRGHFKVNCRFAPLPETFDDLRTLQRRS